MPLGVPDAILAKPNVSLLSIPVNDYPRAMVKLTAKANRIVGMFETTPPEDGRVTPGAFGLGVSTIVDLADVVVREENPQAPRLPGLSFPEDVFNIRFHVNCQLPCHEPAAPTNAECRLADRVADLIPDPAMI